MEDYLLLIAVAGGMAGAVFIHDVIHRIWPINCNCKCQEGEK